MTETFPNPAALRKAQHEVAEFHRFRKHGEDLVSINEKICALRPVEKQREGWTDRKKNGCCNPSGNRALSEMPSACDTQSSAFSICSQAPV